MYEADVFVSGPPIILGNIVHSGMLKQSLFLQHFEDGLDSGRRFRVSGFGAMVEHAKVADDACLCYSHKYNVEVVIFD